MKASNPVAIGSNPMMMPPTPRTVSAEAGLHAFADLICWIVTESGHVAFGNWFADATAAVHSMAVTARKRVSILCIGIPLRCRWTATNVERDRGGACLLAVPP